MKTSSSVRSSWMRITLMWRSNLLTNALLEQESKYVHICILTLPNVFDTMLTGFMVSRKFFDL
jgi:hypothetical protein